MDQPNPTFAKISIIDTGKFEQWKFRIQQYLQNEHYALWKVIEFGDSYKAPQEEAGKDAASESSAKKKGRTVVITTEDMQKRRNDVKARTTLLLGLPDEHPLRFSKLQSIVSHLEFMDVEIEQYDLNRKFLTSLAPEWLMYTIVWRNRDDLDTISLDDVYNHLKLYEPGVQKKSESNSQNMAFISSANTSSEKGEVHTASVPTASTQVSTASADVADASISHDTICAYIASQSNGSQIKYKKKTGKKITIQGTDVAGFDKSKVECFNCHKMGHFAMECRAPRSQNRGRRESYKQGSKEEEPTPKALMAIDGIRWDWSYMANEEENHALVADDEASTEFTLMAKSSSSSENKEVRELIRTRRVLDTMSSPSIESNTSDLQNSNSFVSEHGESSSSIMSKPMIKFVKAADSPTIIKTSKTETVKKPPVKYAEMYRNTSKIPKVRGNQRNWNNLKSQQLGKDFLMKNKACFKCGHFDHLAYDCGVWVEKGKTWPTNNFAHKNVTPRADLLKTGRTPIANVVSQAVKNDVSSLRYIALPNWFHEAHMESSNSDAQDACNADVTESSGNSNPTATLKIPAADQMESLTVESVIPTVSSHVPTACLDTSPETLSDSSLISKEVLSPEETPSLDNVLTFSNRFEDTIGVEADLSNMESSIPASPDPTFRIHKDYPKSQIIGPVDTPVQTRHKSKEMKEHNFIATIHQKTTPDLLQFCLFSCFLSQEEPKKIFDALKDPSWVEAMQKELLQFKIQNVWIVVDYPKGIRPIVTKWVLKNKKDERGIMIRNKARLVAQGHTQEEGIDYEEVFAPVARIEAVRLFLAYASFMGFTVYQMDVQSDFLYGTVDEEVYVMQPLGFQDPEFPDRVYKVEKAMYGLHQARRAWSANTPMDKENPWGKDGPGKDVKLYLYRSMIGSLMYLIASRPDIMFVVCACARHQVTPKECHLHAVKRIFRYLKGHPKLGLWYPKESPFDLVAYSYSAYGGATQDRKSTIKGCQFLGRRLISWQCKKQIIMTTSTTKAEYVAAASGCGQVL
nr:putative ribonuclease H-like domain-containing protein [Tanacetum cinerariifolium]